MFRNADIKQTNLWRQAKVKDMLHLCFERTRSINTKVRVWVVAPPPAKKILCNDATKMCIVRQMMPKLFMKNFVANNTCTNLEAVSNKRIFSSTECYKLLLLLFVMQYLVGTEWINHGRREMGVSHISTPVRENVSWQRFSSKVDWQKLHTG